MVFAKTIVLIPGPVIDRYRPMPRVILDMDRIYRTRTSIVTCIDTLVVYYNII